MTLHFTKTETLTKQQQQQVIALQEHYRKTENHHYKIDPNVLESEGNTNTTHFLWLKETTLVAYMVTNFYTKAELEVAIIYSSLIPFDQFISLAKDQTRELNIPKILLAVDPIDRNTVLQAKNSGLIYSFSEYLLTTQDQPIPLPTMAELHLRDAMISDIPLIKQLDLQGFNLSSDVPVQELPLFKMAIVNGKVVGKVRLEKTATSVGIFAFVVAADQRSKGYGQEILAQVIADSQQSDLSLIYLEVAVANSSALRLYERSGFKKIAVFDYLELVL